MTSRVAYYYVVMYKQEIPYDLEHVYNWMYQAASGLEFLHVQLNHMHRDVKPAKLVAIFC